MPGESKNVFLSYASEDSQAAARMVNVRNFQGCPYYPHLFFEHVGTRLRSMCAMVAELAAIVLFAASPLSAQVPVVRFAEPPAQYALVVRHDVMVPMRDGTRLATDLYIPDSLIGRLPAILLRTPYNKASDWNIGWARRFAEQGYVVAYQDVRGKFESEGTFSVSADESTDGFDTVTWMTKQDWSNSKVGTHGCSYSGENEVEMAKLRHPAQLAMNARAASGALQYFGSLRGGALELASTADWFLSNGSKINNRAPQGQGPSTPLNEPALFRSLPLKGMVARAGVPNTDWDDFVSHAEGDPWWRTRGYVSESDSFDVPSLYVDAWYDFGAGDVFRLADLIRRRSTSASSAKHQFIIIAPTTHCDYEAATEHTVVGERDLGDARYPFFGLYLAWFDHWLKGVDNGVDRMPAVQLYVMGRNQWRGENDWPLSRAAPTKFYLQSHGHANGRFGDGTLSRSPSLVKAQDDFVYDPATPVPSVGGPSWSEHANPGGVDQSDVEMRSDVLVYSSAPLQVGVEVTGPLEAVLHVSSDAPDTDFTVKLVDVYPDGRAFNIQEGIRRMRYREGFGKVAWMRLGQVYEIHVDLNATSNYFAPGHKIRVEVSSSNFPRFDRNLNTGGDNFSETSWRVAHNVLHHSAADQSYVLLPVVP